MSGKVTQRSIILEYFLGHPDMDVHHPDVVDWAVKEYKEQTGKVFRDPDRQIRSLHQEGLLIKIKNGVYRYSPHGRPELDEFTSKQKREIFKRGNYRCAICGKRKRDGIELHVDHIRPRDKGGKSVISNGQILCAEHNFRKKNYSQTETGKRMFINLWELANREEDVRLADFCSDVLDVFIKHGINGHIVWNASDISIGLTPGT